MTITSVNGSATLPTSRDPLPADPRRHQRHVGVQHRGAHARRASSTPRSTASCGLSLAPGTVIGVTGTGARANNILLAGGKASGVVQVTNVYGPTSLWVTDLGYVPAPPGTVPECSNGIDDNHNHLIDYPADPGCYAADDNTEDGGSYAAGVSPPVQYRLPTVIDVRGRETVTVPTSATMPCPAGYSFVGDICSYQTGGASTPYQNEAIEIATAAPAWLVVTALSSQGFYVTDLNPTAVASGYNSLFMYNFIGAGGHGASAIGSPPWPAPPTTSTATPSSGSPRSRTATRSAPTASTSTAASPSRSSIARDATSPARRTPPPPTCSRSRAAWCASPATPSPSTSAPSSRSATSSARASPTAISTVTGRSITPRSRPTAPWTSARGPARTRATTSPDCSEFTAYSARSEYKVHLVIGGVTDTSSMIEVDTSALPTFDPTAYAGQRPPLRHRQPDRVLGRQPQLDGRGPLRRRRRVPRGLGLHHPDRHPLDPGLRRRSTPPATTMKERTSPHAISGP